MSYSTTVALSRNFMCGKCRLPKPLAGSRLLANKSTNGGGRKRRVCAECAVGRADGGRSG